jgi:hypothetical protein
MITPSQLVTIADQAFATALTANLGTFNDLTDNTDREDGGFAGEVEKLEVAAGAIRYYFVGSETAAEIDVNDLMLYREHVSEGFDTTWADYIENTRDLI